MPNKVEAARENGSITRSAESEIPLADDNKTTAQPRPALDTAANAQVPKEGRDANAVQGQQSTDGLDEFRQKTFGPEGKEWHPTIGNSSRVSIGKSWPFPVKYETDRTTITLPDGSFHIISHDPPRTSREVLDNRQRQIDTREGKLQPRERVARTGDSESQGADRTSADAAKAADRTKPNAHERKFVGFVSGEELNGNGGRSAEPIRVLRGQTIASIVAGEPFGDVGNFGRSLYLETYGKLLSENKIGPELFDNNNFAKLEKLFADKIREILPQFRKDWRAQMSAVDNEFLANTNKRSATSETVIQVTKTQEQSRQAVRASEQPAKVQSDSAEKPKDHGASSVSREEYYKSWNARLRSHGRLARESSEGLADTSELPEKNDRRGVWLKEESGERQPVTTERKEAPVAEGEQPKLSHRGLRVEQEAGTTNKLDAASRTLSESRWYTLELRNLLMYSREVLEGKRVLFKGFSQPEVANILKSFREAGLFGGTTEQKSVGNSKQPIATTSSGSGENAGTDAVANYDLMKAAEKLSQSPDKRIRYAGFDLQELALKANGSEGPEVQTKAMEVIQALRKAGLFGNPSASADNGAVAGNDQAPGAPRRLSAAAREGAEKLGLSAQESKSLEQRISELSLVSTNKELVASLKELQADAQGRSGAAQQAKSISTLRNFIESFKKSGGGTSGATGAAGAVATIAAPFLMRKYLDEGQVNFRSY